MNVKSANVKSAIAGLAFMSIAAFGVSARATGVNLITNGNFSNVTQGTTSLVENNAYGAAVQGWTTTSGYTFLLTASSSTGFYNGYIANGSGGSSGLYTGSGTPYQISLYSGITASPVGGNFIAQDANYLQGTLSQTVSGLTVGDTYAVSFYQAAAQQSGFTGSTGEQWFVSLGGQTDYAPQINIGRARSAAGPMSRRCSPPPRRRKPSGSSRTESARRLSHCWTASRWSTRRSRRHGP